MTRGYRVAYLARGPLSASAWTRRGGVVISVWREERVLRSMRGLCMMTREGVERWFSRLIVISV